MEPEEPAQPQESAGSTIQAWLRGHWLVAVVGGLFVLVFATILANLGGDEPEDLTPTTLAEGTRTPPTQAPTEVDSHQIPPIDGCTLISDDEVLSTLGVSDNTGVFRFSGGEGCVWQLDGGSQTEGLSVELVPGNPSDFATGAMLNDATGVPVPDIGDVAVWFGGKGAGTLSAVRQTDIGYLFMRLAINRPDVDDQERLGLASSLITSAMDMVQFGPPPPVEADLCELVTDNEAEELLAPHRQGRAAARDPLFVIDNFAGLVDLTQPGDYSCTKLIFTEIYVKVESAPDSDFGFDANVDGVPGEPVAGVGDMAMWFENVPYSSPFASPHEIDVLSVAREDASFRIVLALPDLTPDEQFETASELARKALGRLPGGLGEVITIEWEPVDRSNASFVDNLLAKELAGEWTRGEGLVATLRLFAGEIDQSQVLRHSELLDHSGTGIVRMAQEYLETGEDTASAAEIERLLGRLLVRDPRGTTASAQSSASRARSLSIALADDICYSPYLDHGDPCFESLEAGGDRASAAETERPSGLLLMHDPRETTAEARSSASRAHSLSIALADDICYSVFPDHGDPCFKWIEAGPDPLSAKYILWYPDLDEWQGWVRGSVAPDDWGGSPIHSAIIESVRRLEAMSGEMPPVSVWLTPYEGGSWVDWAPHGCSIYLASGAQELRGGFLQQAVASTVARCYIDETISELQAHYEANRWWMDGLAWYLSDVIYPDMSLELEILQVPSVLALEERASTLHGRALANMPFFEYLDAALGLEGTLSAARTIASSGLEGVSGIDELLHEYAKALTDGVIVDQGGAHPYGPPVLPAPLSPGLTVPAQVMPFGVERVRASVGPGEYACLEYPEVINLDIIVSWREGPPGQSGTWSEDLPKTIQGQGVFLLTTTQPGGLFEIRVKKVVEDPEDCEDEEEPESEPESEPPPENCNCDPTDYFLLWQDIPDILKELFPW